MTYITSIERLGREKGRAEGRAEGQLNLILLLLTHRCGTLAPATETQIVQLTPDQLQQLAEALLDFTGMEDLHAWMQAHVAE